MKKSLLLLLLFAMPTEAVETITVVASNKQTATYNAVWAANMKCNRKGFWAEPLAIGITPTTVYEKYWRNRKPIVIQKRKYEASLDYVCDNVWPNNRWSGK